MNFKHCDEYIRDKTQPKCLRKFLLFQRKPPLWRWHKSWGYPQLFANHEGKRVKIVMASRFGDVGITSDLEARNGYSLRLFLEQLSDFSEEP